MLVYYKHFDMMLVCKLYLSPFTNEQVLTTSRNSSIIYQNTKQLSAQWWRVRRYISKPNNPWEHLCMQSSSCEFNTLLL